MSAANVSSVFGKMHEKDVIQLIAEALDVPAAKLDITSDAANIAEWDSMGILSILLAMDREGVKCDIGNTESLQSVRGVIDAFRSAGKLE